MGARIRSAKRGHAASADFALGRDWLAAGEELHLPPPLRARILSAKQRAKWIIAALPAAETDAAAAESNLEFVNRKYVPPARMAPKGISLAQLAETRRCLWFLLAVLYPASLPRRAVAEVMSSLSTFSGQQIADVVDHTAYSLWRVQEDGAAGRLKYGAKAVLRPLDGTRRFTKWETVHYRLAMSPTGAFVVKSVPAPHSAAAPTTSVMTTLYTLRLEKNRWYVGSTSQGLDERVEEHRRAFTGASASRSGAAWTAMYQVMAVVRQRQVPEHLRSQEEDAEVARLAQLHGVDSVRGGSYTRAKLTANEKAALERVFRTAKTGRFLAPAAEAQAAVIPAPSDDLVALQRLVTDMRRRTSSRGVTRKEAKALGTAIINDNSAGKYLRTNHLQVFSLTAGLPDDFWERKPLPPGSRDAFTTVVTDELSFAVPPQKRLLAMSVVKNTGFEWLLVVPVEAREPLLARLLSIGDSSLSAFVGLSPAQLHKNLGLFFHGIPQKLSERFCNNMEVTQLLKRSRKIAKPRAVTGLYAGHRFGMDTTFMGKPHSDSAESKYMSAQAATDTAAWQRGDIFRGSTRWWPRHAANSSVSLAKKNSGVWFENIHEYMKLVETGEGVRAAAASLVDGNMEPGTLAPFPYIHLKKLVKKNGKSLTLAERVEFRVPGVDSQGVPLLCYHKSAIAAAAVRKSDRNNKNTRSGIQDADTGPEDAGPKALAPTLLATVIDMYSRKAWVYPAAAEGAHHLYSSLALRFAMADGGLDVAPPVLSTDNGSEFHTMRDKQETSDDASARAVENESAESLANNGIFHVSGVRQLDDADPQRRSRGGGFKCAAETIGCKISRAPAAVKHGKHAKNRLTNFLDGEARISYMGRFAEMCEETLRLDDDNALQLVDEAKYVERAYARKVSSGVRDANRHVTAKERETYVKELAALRRQTEPPADNSRGEVRNPFMVYAGAMGAEVVTTTVPMYKQSGAHGPIESFHRTFKMLLAKETALHASEAADNSVDRDGSRVAEDTWCLPTKGSAASADKNLWCVTTTLVYQTLQKYNNTVHGSTGVTPNQLWDASRLVRTSRDPHAADHVRALQIVSRAEETMIRSRGKQRKPSPPMNKGDYVRILLTAPDRGMSRDNREQQKAVAPDNFVKGYDWKWTSRIYEITARRQVNGSAALLSHGVPEYQFFVYTVSLVRKPANVARREHEPQFNDGIRLTAEYLLPVDIRFLQEHTGLARLFHSKQEDWGSAPAQAPIAAPAPADDILGGELSASQVRTRDAATVYLHGMRLRRAWTEKAVATVPVPLISDDESKPLKERQLQVKDRYVKLLLRSIFATHAEKTLPRRGDRLWVYADRRALGPAGLYAARVRSVIGSKAANPQLSLFVTNKSRKGVMLTALLSRVFDAAPAPATARLVDTYEMPWAVALQFTEKIICRAFRAAEFDATVADEKVFLKKVIWGLGLPREMQQQHLLTPQQHGVVFVHEGSRRQEADWHPPDRREANAWARLSCGAELTSDLFGDDESDAFDTFMRGRSPRSFSTTDGAAGEISPVMHASATAEDRRRQADYTEQMPRNLSETVITWEQYKEAMSVFSTPDAAANARVLKARSCAATYSPPAVPRAGPKIYRTVVSAGNTVFQVGKDQGGKVVIDVNHNSDALGDDRTAKYRLRLSDVVGFIPAASDATRRGQ